MRSISLWMICEASVVPRARSSCRNDACIAMIEVEMPSAITKADIATSRMVKPPRAFFPRGHARPPPSGRLAVVGVESQEIKERVRTVGLSDRRSGKLRAETHVIQAGRE